MSSPQPPNTTPSPPRIPLTYWLLTGGTGMPPAAKTFSRMASERKAVHREAKAYAENRKAAFAAHEEAQKAALAALQEKWPATGSSGGGSKRRKLGRRELMSLYGPRGTARGGNRDDHGDEGQRPDVGDDGASADAGAGADGESAQ